jgi:Ser-tRNA(Ala) deacylase AlaX
MSDNTPPTELIHLTYDGNFELECDAKVLCCRVINDELQAIELDRTTMHPQGGGQPTDVGTISAGEEQTVTISKVTLDRDSGIVTHEGTVTTEPLQVGDHVKVSVKAKQRRILSECHTAGHVVDSAMARCGQVLPASKGYHFLDSPYVEYKGSVPPDERPKLLEKLQHAFADLVNEDLETKIETMSREKAEGLCKTFDLDTFAKPGQPLRIVTVAGWHCPCGGTHVKSTGELKKRQWGITGLKCKKDVVRVRYGYDKLSDS